jgi:hypothetical protein
LTKRTLLFINNKGSLKNPVEIKESRMLSFN